jgi:hypothetical protein
MIRLQWFSCSVLHCYVTLRVRPQSSGDHGPVTLRRLIPRWTHNTLAREDTVVIARGKKKL